MGTLRDRSLRKGDFGAGLTRAICVLALAALVIVTSGCKEKGLRRPSGWFRLGAATELIGRTTYFPDEKVLLRYDSGGFYVMSTDCTYDLSSLERRTVDGKDRWASTYTSSLYDEDGSVLRGPAEIPLPYYKLRIEPGVYGGPVSDTLFVQVGTEVPPTWRLSVAQK